MEVLVENVNDNPPNFAQNHYTLEVNEVSRCLDLPSSRGGFVDSLFCLLQLSPVNSSVGLIEASDVDSEPLYYRLEPAPVSHRVDWAAGLTEAAQAQSSSH